MAMRDEDFGTALTLTEGDEAIWSPPMSAPTSEPRDWQSLCEQERARAEAAGSARGRVALGGSRRPQRWECVEVAVQGLPAEAERGRAGDRGPPPRGQGRAVLAGRSGALAGVALRSPQRVERVLHDRSAADEVARLHKALASKGRKDATGPLSRENARLRKALERSQGQKDEVVALRGEVSALRKSERAAQSVRSKESIRLGKALERTQKQKDTIKALRGEVDSLTRETRQQNRENGRLRRELEWLQRIKATARGLSDEVELLRAELAAYHDQMNFIDWQDRRITDLQIALDTSAFKTERLEAELAERPLLPAALKRLRKQEKTIESLQTRNERLEEELAKLRLEPGRPVEGGLREQERAAEEAGHGTQARPATRRARPRSHPAARASGEDRTAQPTEGCADLFLLRQALCRQRRACDDADRDRGQGPHPQDRADALAPGLRLRVVAPGSDCAAGAAAVPRNALRNQLLGTVFVRALCVPAPAVPGRGVVRGPGAGGLAGHAGQQPEALRAAVRPGLPGDSRAPEPDDGAPCRRDRLAGTGVPRQRPVEPRLAVDFGQQGRGLLPYRPLAQRRGREGPVRRHRLHRLRGLRPLQRLQSAGARTRRQGHPLLVLGSPAARLHRGRGRPGRADGMVRGMDRADRGDLPAERRTVEALRPRSRTPDTGLRRSATQTRGRRSSACSRTPRRNWPACRTRTVGQSPCARCSTTAKGCASSRTIPRFRWTTMPGSGRSAGRSSGAD